LKCDDKILIADVEEQKVCIGDEVPPPLPLARRKGGEAE
jgi:hypothetical protein